MANLLEKSADTMHSLEQIQLYLLGEGALVLQAGVEQQSRLLAVQRVVSCRNDILAAVLGVGNLTIRFNPLLTNGQGLLAELKTLYLDADTLFTGTNPNRLVELPVQYGGEFGADLEFVANYCRLTVPEVITLHSSVTYDVVCIGFLPGFPYLAGLPQQLACPRRASPRVQVPAGSVGIGGSQTGIYPCSSPGGWQLIGHCPTILFNPRKTPPSLLQAGDQVRFVPIGVT